MGRVVAAFALAAFLLVPAPARAAHPVVLVATLDGVINPITDSYVQRAVGRAVREGDTALVIALDTPGGLDTSMRHIIKTMLAAPVPVVIYVSPSGARAASAGLFITQAADVAAMAPGTNIGSAHPVSIGGPNPAPNASPSPGSAGADIMTQKIENDAAAYIRSLAAIHHRNADWAEKAVRQSANVPVDEAVQLKVVDLESRDLSSLLEDLDGRQVDKGGQTYTLHTANAAIERIELSEFDRLLEAVSDPDVAYLLLLLAIIAIGFWVTHPGFFLPGVVGVIAGILAGVALFNLPINTAGVVLILLAMAMFVIDLKAPTHGVLTTGGVVAMALGSLLLIDTGFLSEGVNIFLILVTVVLLGGSFGFVLRKVLEARRRPFAAGEESIVGKVGTVREPLRPVGLVFVDGALWQATSVSGPIEAGSQVRVVGIDGLRLRVNNAGSESAASAPTPPKAASQ